MTLDNTMSAENIKSSLEKYMYDNFVTTEGLTVHWAGAQDIDLNTVDEWIQPRNLFGEPIWGNHVTSTKKGWERPILLNINIFVKKGSTNNLHRLEEIRDKVAGYFNIGQTIDFMNYKGDNSFLDRFIVRELLTDSNIPSGDQLFFQHSFTVVLHVIQGWTA